MYRIKSLKDTKKRRKFPVIHMPFATLIECEDVSLHILLSKFRFRSTAVTKKIQTHQNGEKVNNERKTVTGNQTSLTSFILHLERNTQTTVLKAIVMFVVGLYSLGQKSQSFC